AASAGGTSASSVWGGRIVDHASRVVYSLDVEFGAENFRCARYSIRYRLCQSSWAFNRSSISSTLGAFSCWTIGTDCSKKPYVAEVSRQKPKIKPKVSITRR